MKTSNALRTEKKSISVNNNGDCKHLMFTKDKNNVLDTITLTTDDFNFDLSKNCISDYPFMNGYNPKPITSEYSNIPLLFDIHNKAIYGDYIRPFKPIRETAIIDIHNFTNTKTGETKPYMKIQLSVPKFIGKQNIYLADDSDFVECINELSEELKNMGINTNIMNCNISRLDVTKNIQTDYPFYMYIPMLRKLNMSRATKDTEHSGQTYLTGNNSKELCCYDKIAEMKEKNENTNGLPQNIFRSEFRSLKRETVKSIYDFEKTKDVLSGFSDIKNIYKETLRKSYFKIDKLENDRETDTMQIFLNCMEKEQGKGKKNWYEVALQKILIAENKKILNSISTKQLLELYADNLRNKGYAETVIKQMKSRQKRKIEEVNNMMFQYMDSDIENVSIQDLYNEIFEKLLNE